MGNEEKLMWRKNLTTPWVHAEMFDRGRTFADIAKALGCSEQDLVKELMKKFTNNFKRYQNKDRENRKAQRRGGKKAKPAEGKGGPSKIAHENRKPCEGQGEAGGSDEGILNAEGHNEQPATFRGRFFTEVIAVEHLDYPRGGGSVITYGKPVPLDDLRVSLERATVKFNVAAANYDAEGAITGSLENDAQDKSRIVAELEEKLRDAKKAHSDAEGKLKKHRERMVRLNTAMDEWGQTACGLKNEIAYIESNLLYLVAPGYSEKLPDVGKLVSVVNFGDDRVTLENGELLIHDPSAMEVLDSGYNAISEAKAAYEFAKLVIKYDTQGADYNLLVDDERIWKILEAQGLKRA